MATVKDPSPLAEADRSPDVAVAVPFEVVEVPPEDEVEPLGGAGGAATTVRAAAPLDAPKVASPL